MVPCWLLATTGAGRRASFPREASESTVHLLYLQSQTFLNVRGVVALDDEKDGQIPVTDDNILSHGTFTCLRLDTKSGFLVGSEKRVCTSLWSSPSVPVRGTINKRLRLMEPLIAGIFASKSSARVLAMVSQLSHPVRQGRRYG